jgi:transposase-like protein
LSTNQAKERIDPEAKEHLATLYWSYSACKRGFLEGCRPLICVDGCHIKTRYKGNLLTTVGIDPNDCIYPIAMGLVEIECTSSWEWFLTTLRDDLNITNTSPFTIMSDKQKGLINAVKKVFPDAEHRFCVRHLY